MSISGIDASTMAPRSTEASSIVGKEQHQLQHIGENGAVSFEKNQIQDSQRAVEAKKSETDEYDFDEKEGSRGHGGRGRRRKKQQEKEAPMAPRSDSSFDIMV